MIVINAEIHTMDNDNTVIANGYVKMEKGKITGIGDMEEFSENLPDIINAEGKKIYPGYIDVHTHLGMFEDSLCFVCNTYVIRFSFLKLSYISCLLSL